MAMARGGGFMELEEWLRLYQALSTTAGMKERSYWTIVEIFLLANCLLIFPLSLFLFSYEVWEGRFFITVLAGIGVLVCIAWSLSQRRSAQEIEHISGLLRSIEGQFAGGDFHRSLYKLLAGEEVCIPSTSWKCKEWHPEVTHLGPVTRVFPRVLISLLPVIFLLAWATLGIVSWIV